MKAKSKQEYIAAWSNHIDLLNSVAFDMMAQPECQELEKLMARAKELVCVAGENLDLD